MTLSKIIFTEGKEIAMKSLFTTETTTIFPYVALGYANESGFTDSPNLSEKGFVEINDETYKRIKLSYKDTEVDSNTNKVTVNFTANLDYSNIQNTQTINQLAVVDSATAHDANTKFYSATSFPPFEKHSQNAITFVLGFRF